MNGKAMLLAAGVMAAANPVHAAGKALIIGIDRYAETALSLVGSTEDARNMGDFAVRRWGFAPTDVKLLLDGAATRAAILEALDRWLVDGTKPGDTVLFYFSGHGYHVPDRDGDERAENAGDDQDEVLVAHDGRLYADGRYEGFVIDDEIAARLKKLKDRQVVMLFDSCHSGTMTRSIASGGGGVAKKPNFGAAAGQGGVQGGGGASRSVSDAAYRSHQRIQPDMTDGAGNVAAFFAVGSTQLAQVNQRVRPMQGVFTEAFLRGASGAADANRNGVVSLAEIESFVRTEAHAYCDRNPCETGMTPFMEAPAGMMHKDLITFAQAPTLQEAAVDAIGPGSFSEAVEVAVSPAGPLRVGQTYDIAVTSPIDGTLVVIDLPPDNDVKLVFPNQWSMKVGASYKVKAGQTIRFPDRYHGFAIKATPPAGRGSVLALAIQDDIPFSKLQGLIAAAADPAATRGGLVTVPDPLRFLGELGQALVVPWTGELTTRGVKWAMGHYDYEIVK